MRAKRVSMYKGNTRHTVSTQYMLGIFIIYVTCRHHLTPLSLQPRVKASRITGKERSYLSMEQGDDLPSIETTVGLAGAFPYQERGEMGLLHFPWQPEKPVHFSPSVS